MPESDPLEVFVLGRLTVHTPHGDLVKTQFGSAEVKRARKTGLPLGIGDDLKAASSDALKKASSLLGPALDLYRSDDEKSDGQDGDSRAGGNGSIKTDPMTAFWLAVKERGLSREEGKARLERSGAIRPRPWRCWTARGTYATNAPGSEADKYRAVSWRRHLLLAAIHCMRKVNVI